MQSVGDLDNPFKCLWTKITTQNSGYFVATIHHPSGYEYNEFDLIEFLIDSCEQLMLSQPDSKIILAGYVNDLNIRSVQNQLSFTLLVKFPTRGQKILDVFITNAPNYWKNVKVVKSLVRFNHDMIITYPRDIVQPKRTNSYFRVVGDHRKLNMLKLRDLESVDWDMITSNCDNLDERIIKFYEILWPKFDKCFPLIRVTTLSRDPTLISPLVKHLLKQDGKPFEKKIMKLTYD